MEAPAAAEPKVTVKTDTIEQQATAMAEAMLPQLKPAVQRMVSDAVAEMEQTQLEAMRRSMGQVAAGLRPPSRDTARGGGPTPYASFEDYIGAVVASSRRNVEVDGGLKEIMAAATGMSEGVGADGGFLVQTDFATDLLELIHETGIIFSMIPANRRFTASGNANAREFPAIDETSRADGSRMGGVRAYWTGEAQAITASRPKFRKVRLELDKISALTYHTIEEAEDTPGLAEMIRGFHTNEIGFKLDDAVVRGSGAGEPLGFLNAEALITVDAEAGQAADTVNYDNVRKMWARVSATNRRTGFWGYNQALEPQLATLYLAIGTSGVPVWMPAGGISGQPYATLFGRPAFPVEQASAPGDVGDFFYADPAAFLALTKGGARQSVSEHVAFTSDEVAVKTGYRVDFRPAWTSALSPYKGTDTISPFVVLAAR